MKTSKNLMGMFATGIMIYVLSGCVVRPAVTRPAPPPVRVEVVPRAPSHRHTWVPGHHRWRRNHYVWVPGHYRRIR